MYKGEVNIMCNGKLLNEGIGGEFILGGYIPLIGDVIEIDGTQYKVIKRTFRASRKTNTIYARECVIEVE